MIATEQGSIRLFRVFGIQVYLHWSWFLIAFYDVSTRRDLYSTLGWNVLEVITLFSIVLLHEFGHSLACRQVGGKADQIVLWPLGGLAFVRPPPRPGAELWSIVAGPLVNVVLAPILWGAFMLAGSSASEDLSRYLYSTAVVNTALLVFNLAPIYPLDGGQILRSLLWFVVGRGTSLLIATVLGFVGSAVLGAWALYSFFQRGVGLWYAAIAFFIFQQCRIGYQYAQALRRLEKTPTHSSFHCPSCKQSPPAVAAYTCVNCRAPFDPFASAGQCPNCARVWNVVPCLHCGTASSLGDWAGTPPLPNSEGEKPLV